MRFLAILVCVSALLATGWHAIMRGTTNPQLLGAPQIQQIVADDVKGAIENLASHPLEVDVDGRNVHLSGPVNSAEERDALLAAASGARLLVKLSDDLEVLPTASPFTFSAVKDDNGGIRLAGHVPDQATRELLVSQARGLSDGAVISDNLSLAAGSQGDNWSGMAGAALISG